jgi:hypothetical protein
MHQHLEETFHTSQKDAPILSGMSGNFQFCACALMDLKCPSTVKGPALSTLLLFTMSDSSKDLKRSLGFCTEDGSFDLDSKIANDKVFKDVHDSALLLKVQEGINKTKDTINEMVMGNTAKDLKAASKMK